MPRNRFLLKLKLIIKLKFCRGLAFAKDPNSVKGYGGGVFINTSTGDAPSIICQTKEIQGTTGANSLVPASGAACGGSILEPLK